MRRSDEILSAFPGQSVNGKRYLLRCLERQPLALDAGDVRAFLLQAEAGDGHEVARLAEETYFHRLARDRTLRAGGAVSDEAGVWTRFLGDSPAEAASSVDLRDHAQAPLEALVPALDRCLARSTPAARAALRVLGHLRGPRTLPALSSVLQRIPLLPDLLVALSVQASPEAEEMALDRLRVVRDLPLQPGLLHPLRSLAGDRAHDFLLESTRTPDLLPAVAAALEGFQARGYRDLIEPVLLASAPWTTMHALESLGRMGGEAQGAELASLYPRLRHPMLRAACLQALGETRSTRGVECARDALEDPEPLVRSAAIETLVSLPERRESYRDAVLAQLDAAHPRLAMHAALACVLLDPPRATRRVGTLLASGDAARVMQAVHTLAYVDHPRSGELIARVTRQAPRGPLQRQGLWALGRRAARERSSARELSSFLRSEHGEVRRLAAAYLAGVEESSRVGAARRLLEALQDEEEPAAAAGFLEAIALMGPAAEKAGGALASYGRHPDSRVRRAAAWGLATAFPESPAAAELSEMGPAMAPWEALRRWHLGRGGLDLLADALGAEDARISDEALLAARWVVAAPAYAGEAPTLAGLAGALRATPDTPSASPAASTPETYRPPPAPPSALDEAAPGSGDAAGIDLEVEDDVEASSAAATEDAAVALSLFSLDAQAFDAAPPRRQAGRPGARRTVILAVATLAGALALGLLLRAVS